MRGSKHLSFATVSFLLAIVMASSLRAQGKRLERTLLWEISGNGLPSPSYLYGTMHVTNRRAFNFADSVLLKLHACTIFASEVEIDSAIREVLGMYMVGAAEDDASDSLYKAGGWEDDDEGGDDSADTVAAFVPGDSVVAASDSIAPVTPDSIVLATPDSIVVASPEVKRLPTIVANAEPPAAAPPKRRGLHGDPLSNDFFRSASEPRPDDRPVILDAYLFRLAKHEGKELVGLESVDEQINAFSDISFADIWKAYVRRNSGKRKKRLPLTLDPEKLQAMVLDYYERGDLDGIHTFFVDNWPPSYYTALLTNRNHHMADRSVPLMMRGSTFIAVGAGHLPGNEGLIDLFRKKGYTVRPVKALRTGLAATYVEGSVRPPWHDLVSPAGAFAVSMPARPVDISGALLRYSSFSRQGMGRLYFWPDLGGGITYGAGYVDYPHNYLLSRDPDRFLDNGGDGADAPSYADREHVRKIVVEGLPGRDLEIKGENNHVRRLRLLLRGNRLYKLMVDAAPEFAHSADADRFFSSFTLGPIRSEPWREYRLPEFSVLLPDSPRVIGDEDGDRRDAAHMYGGVRESYMAASRTTTRALDSNSGRFYQVDREVYGEYYEAGDSGLFFDRALNELKFREDSILFERAIVQDGRPGREIEAVRSMGSAYRVRLLLDGNRLYRVWAELPPSELHDSVTTAFFDSFHLGPDRSDGNIFSSKGSHILDDLASSDSTRHIRALWAARYYAGFSAEHLPRIYDLIDRRYADDSAEDGGTRSLLIGTLGKLHDSATVPFLRRIITADSGSPGIRSAALSVLAGIPTHDAAELFIDGMLDTSVAGDPGHISIFYHAGSDSASLGVLFPRLLSLLDRPAYRPSVYRLAVLALDSGALEPAALIPYGDTIIADLGGALLERATFNPDDDPWSIVDKLRGIVGCADYVPNRPELIPLLAQALADPDAEVRMAAAVALIRRRVSVATAVLAELAADPMERVALYGRLERMGRLDLFPKEYMSQKDIAEGLLATWINSDEDFSADSLRLLAEREVTVGGKPARVFLFAFRSSYRDSDDESWMVGISGPQPIERDRIDLSGAKTRSNYDALEDMSIDAHFQSLLRDP
jgi:uncharacterized protein YbaP (TraB family)/HEAT repeat protein